MGPKHTKDSPAPIRNRTAQFASINKAALAFGGLFVLQALLLGVAAIQHRVEALPPDVRRRRSAAGPAGPPDRRPDGCEA